MIAGLAKDLPYYGKNGLNAGIMLLNLQQLRSSSFSKERDRIIEHFLPKGALPLGDQDVLNAYSHRHPERVHVMPCIYNFRSDTGCNEGLPAILHGNRNLKDERNSSYSSLYKLFESVVIFEREESKVS